MELLDKYMIQDIIEYMPKESKIKCKPMYDHIDITFAYMGASYTRHPEIRCETICDDDLASVGEMEGNLSMVLCARRRNRYDTYRMDRRMKLSFYGGDHEIIKGALEMADGGLDLMSDMLYGAYWGGHKDLIKILTETGFVGAEWRTRWNKLIKLINQNIGMDITAITGMPDKRFRGACRGGHMELIKDLMEHGEKNWNEGLIGACKGGHYDIAKYMLDKGADNSFDCMMYAYSNGDMRMIELLASQNNEEYICHSDNLLGLCYGIPNVPMEQNEKYIKLIDYIIDKRYHKTIKQILDKLLVHARCYKKKYLIKYLIEIGADVNIGFLDACENEDKEMMLFMIDLGATK